MTSKKLDKFTEWDNIFSAIEKAQTSLLKTCAIRFLYNDVGQAYSYLQRNPHNLDKVKLNEFLVETEKYLKKAEELIHNDLINTLYPETD
jgi:hypothetical protein